MTVAHKLVGNSMQMAVCQLAQGQVIYCEPGKFLWKTTNVSVKTRLTRPVGSSGSMLQKAMDVGKKALAGEGLAFQYFTAHDGSGLVSFAGVLPGEMRALELDGHRGWYAEKDAFVAAESTVKVGLAFSEEGFVLERITGSGTVLIAGAGNFIEVNPAKYGGTIEVDTGCVVAFEDTVQYAVDQVGGPSVQNAVTAMFGGGGLTLATLSGDGLVILQSMTIEGLAKALAKNMSGGRE